MTVVKVKPVRTTGLNLFNEFDRIFDEMLRPAGSFARPANGSLKSQPAVNILENGNAFHLQLAAPGLDKKDFQLNVDKDILHIEAKREPQAVEGETYKRREFGYFEFHRSFRLPDTIDTGAIEASYVNGVLTVVLPKKEEAKEKPARSIAIA